VLRITPTTKRSLIRLRDVLASTVERSPHAAPSDDVRYLELRVTRESGLSGRVLSQVKLTENAVIVAIRHDGATLIPRGHTLLQEGDRVTVIASATSVAEVRAVFEG
jgi:Trk K+ transport system NAD-binding subunit